MIIVSFAALLVSIAVFYAITGSKLKLRAKSVKFKDEKFDNVDAAKSSRDSLIMFAGAFICAGVGLAVTGVWFYGLIGLAGGFFVLKWWKNKQETQRKELLHDQFAEVLSQIESAMGSNTTPAQAIEECAPDMPRPARDVFFEILRLYRTGDSLANAIEKVRKSIGWDDLKILAVSMRLYNSTGCDLKSISKHALESHEDKESSRKAIGAAISQNMMTVRMLTVLPFLVLGAARTISPALTGPLFHTVEGNMVFIICVLWVIIGNILIQRMITTALKGV